MPTYSGSPATSTATTPYYQTRTYQDLLYSVCRAAGIEPGRLLNEDALAIRDYINESLRSGWEWYPWPGLMNTVSDTVSNLANYAEYDIISITKKDPGTDVNPTHYAWFIDGSGINIQTDLESTDTIYLTYRDLWYPFDGTNYDSATTYETGGMAYDTSTGDYYRSLADANLNNAVSDTAWWDRREIPAFLFDYAKWYALAQLREAEGQCSKSAMLQRRAEQALQTEIFKWESRKNHQIRPITRVRKQGN